MGAAGVKIQSTAHQEPSSAEAMPNMDETEVQGRAKSRSMPALVDSEQLQNLEESAASTDDQQMANAAVRIQSITRGRAARKSLSSSRRAGNSLREPLSRQEQLPSRPPPTPSARKSPVAGLEEA